MRLPLASIGRTYRQFFALLGKEKRLLIAVIVLHFCAAAAAVSLPWIIAGIIDAVTAGTTRQWVINQLILTFSLVGVNMILVWTAERQARVLGERMFAHLREDLVSAVVHLPLSRVESAGTGDLLGRTQHDVRNVQFLVRQGISSFIVMVTSVVMTLSAAFVLAPSIAWIILCEFPIVAMVAKWYLPRAMPVYRASSAEQARFAGVISETVDQGHTVDSLQLGPLRLGHATRLLTHMWRLERFAMWVRALMAGMMVLSTLTPLVVLVWLGAALIPSGVVTAGMVTAIVMYCYQVRGPLWEAVYWMDEAQFALVGLQRIFGVAEVPVDRTATADVFPAGSIVADKVGYHYRDGVEVLRDVTLHLKPGETLAIVGPSGAGKSTLGRMIAGIHPPSSGSVHVGGVALVDVPERELRSKVALVTQEYHVFVGTLAQNLRLAAPKATDAQLEQVLDVVGAGEWMRSLSAGLETTVGSGGVEVSPAQAQQIALARVLLMNPETVVLDEATSMLDPNAARDLEKGLATLLKGRTVVAIVHKLDMAAVADRIAVMENGRIVELGAHDDLVALGGTYAGLWNTWMTTGA